MLAIGKLGTIAERVGTFIPDLRGLHGYCASSQMQIPDALNLISTLMGNHSAAVLRGEAAATLPKPVTAYVEPVVPKAPREVLFCMRNVRWRGAEGKQRLAG